ncbi:DHA2 family efflux MFS transporter permease subunit [Bosea sp. (in: a-proteobacteria)]|uniref:DHA2 family efflux MFS transporter permease subunit n=1 Tax=Bosea sp. (in: a-proteobacteria) TaxID=1871050 RepID=UPI002604836C|nr:DHA2 family efflux MFS transporter permease subunit [Bosea sp. (in: a-proteobacteria)]MCO5089655.1 DHA2 family efflux MFS transporter permease subunit [Bosea sp. (in: a-proteobacteria)]
MRLSDGEHKPPFRPSPEISQDEPAFVTQRTPRLRILIPVMVAMAFLMEQLDSTIITTAIPDMARSLGTSPVHLNTAVTAYVLTVAAFIPVSGWMADRFGARRVFIAALAIFTIASALCGVANSYGMLVAMRILQGLGGAMMTPVGRLILLRSFPRREMMTAMLYMTLPAIIGPVIGPLLGGFLTTYLSWRWIFYANIPFGIAGIVLALRCLDDARSETRSRFDLRGFLMVGSGIVLLQFALENVSHPVVSTPMMLSLSFTGVLLLFLFAHHARTAASPVVDLTLFRDRAFAVGTLAGGLSRIAINGVPFLLPLMLQLGFGMSAIASGSLTFLISAGAVLSRWAMSSLLRRFGFAKLLTGSAITSAILLAGFALIGETTPAWAIMLYIFIFGLVRAAHFMGTNTLAYADLSDSRLSSATSLGGILQQLSVSLGVSVSASLLAVLNLDNGPLTTGDFHVAFLVLAILPLLAIPGFLLLRDEDGRQVSGYRAGR